MGIGKRVLKYGCLSIVALLPILSLGFCGYLNWREPRSALPKEVEWSDVLAFGSTFGLREGCSFGVYRISDRLRNTLIFKGEMRPDWRRTPLKIRDGQYLDSALGGRQITLYALHATSCASDTARRYRLVEAYGVALDRPGNWVKILNHGEAMIVVAPSQGLAWFLNFG